MWVNMLSNTHTHTHTHTQSVNRLRHFRALILIASCTSGCSFHKVLNTEVVKRWLSSSDNSCGGYSSCKRHSHAPPTLVMDSCSGGHCYGSHFQNLLLQCYICFHSFWNINIQQMFLHSLQYVLSCWYRNTNVASGLWFLEEAWQKHSSTHTSHIPTIFSMQAKSD